MIKALALLFKRPLAQHTIRLAAAARAAEKNLPQRTVDELSAALPAAAMPIGRRRSSAFPDILLFPLLSRHRLVADAVDRLHLHDVGEHAEVLADRHQRRMLVVLGFAHQPSLTYCFFHSSADIGLSLTP